MNRDIYCIINGRICTVKNGENAVAFEWRRGEDSGELLYFFNMFNYDIPNGVDLTNANLYAVQADGQRIPIELREQ